jgi:hypothetical protein
MIVVEMIAEMIIVTREMTSECLVIDIAVTIVVILLLRLRHHLFPREPTLIFALMSKSLVLPLRVQCVRLALKTIIFLRHLHLL